MDFCFLMVWYPLIWLCFFPNIVKYCDDGGLSVPKAKAFLLCGNIWNCCGKIVSCPETCYMYVCIFQSHYRYLFKVVADIFWNWWLEIVCKVTYPGTEVVSGSPRDLEGGRLFIPLMDNYSPLCTYSLAADD